MNYKNISELLNACCACKTQKDADNVLYKALVDNPHAKENIGYALGYLGKEERDRLYPLFESCNHPIFGSGFGRGGKEPTPVDAFSMGAALASGVKDGTVQKCEHGVIKLPGREPACQMCINNAKPKRRIESGKGWKRKVK